MSMNFAIHSLRSVVPNGTPLELGLYSTGSRRWLTNCRRYRGWEHPFIHTFCGRAHLTDRAYKAETKPVQRPPN